MVLSVSLGLLLCVACGLAITTIHHDKPEAITVGSMTTTENAQSSTSEMAAAYNVTLSPLERQKRLLPYQNFYFNQPFNRPHLAGVSAQQYRDFSYLDKNRPLQADKGTYRPKDILYQQRLKYTPFLESNALPGPFTPMIKNQNIPKTQQYIIVNPAQTQEEHKYNIEEEKPITDFSEIYDSLSQLKIRQQALQNKTPYGYRLAPYHRPQKEHEQFRPAEYYSRPKYKIEPSKTTYETFTATNIDLSGSNHQYEPYQYEPQLYQTVPAKEPEVKPYLHQQISIEVPRGSIPLVSNTNLVKKPSGGNRGRPVKPYIVLQQDKVYSKQPVFILRKPKPSPVTEENYTAQKLIPISHLKHHQATTLLRRPIYVQHQPQPEQVYEPQYQVTPAPVEAPIQHYGSYVPRPSYTQEEYGSRIVPKPHKVEFVPTATSPSPQYSEQDQYYGYETLESTSERVGQVPLYEMEEQGTPKLEASRPQPDSFEDDGVENSQSLADILRKLQETNALPQTLTPDNIDNSIKTLVKILNVLKLKQKQQKPIVVQDYPTTIENEAGVDLFDTIAGGTPGKPGVDYPALSTIPKTSFSCKTQRYKGFFADIDTNCQVWHYCDLNGGQASFLCPNGTIFSQVALTCDWWYNVKCSSTPQLYVLNERLYKYIIPLSPKFPEDYTGPLVDKYLALKFQEMEEKLRKQKKGKGNADKTEEDSTEKEEESEESDASEETADSNVRTESVEEKTTTENPAK